MTIIAFYLRLSIADGDLGKGEKDESNSIENQRLLLQGFLDSRQDIEGDVKEYIDDGYTGTNFDRPGFRRMIEDAKKGNVQIIIVKDLSRLGRDYIGVGDYLEQIFPVLGVRFIAVNSSYDSNDYIGKTMGLEMSVTNLVNTLYSKDASKKVRTARETKWKQGISTSGRAPFGYIKDKESRGGLRVDPVASEYVKTVFELCIQGVDTTEIADYLNRKHVPTPGQYYKMRTRKELNGIRKVSDKEWLWDNVKVWTILRNYTYTGAMVHGKTKPVHVGSKSRRSVPRSRQFVVEGTHDAIVSKEMFEEAQVMRQKNSGGMALPQDRGFSLRGKVRCGNCGLTMAYGYRATEPTLHCSHTLAAGSVSKCDRTKHSAKKVEASVLFALKQQLRLVRDVIPEIQAKKECCEAEVGEEMTELDREIDVLKAERIRQYEAYAGGVVSQAEYMKKKRQLSEKIAAAQSEKENLGSALATGKSLFQKCAALESRAEKLTVGENMTRELAKAFIDTVYIYSADRIEVKFLFDDLLRQAKEYTRAGK